MDAVPPEHVRYARWLAVSGRLAFLCLLAAFAAYVSGLLPAAIPAQRVPDLWGHPAREYLATAGACRAACWGAWPPRSEGLNTVAMMLLAAATVPPVLAVIPVFRARRQILVVGLCLVQAGIIAGVAWYALSPG